MNNTPDSPAQTPDDRTDQGGNYWTLFTPGIWKDLHAVLQITMMIGTRTSLSGLLNVGQSNPCSVNSREAFPSVQSLKRPW
jgi:hypothetical protein